MWRGDRKIERSKHNVNNVTTKVYTGSYGKLSGRGSSALSDGSTLVKAKGFSCTNEREKVTSYKGSSLYKGLKPLDSMQHRVWRK